MTRWAIGLAVLLVATPAHPVRSEELTLRMQYFGPERPSPFGAQLWVQVTNDGFTSTSLLERLKASELVIDGRSFKRGDSPYEGPPGLPAKGSWEGCLAIQDYRPEGLTPGSHRLALRLGSSKSDEIHIKVAKPVPDARHRRNVANK